MIDKRTGHIRLDKGGKPLLPGEPEDVFLGAHERRATLVVENGEFRTYAIAFPHATAQACFRANRLWMVAIELDGEGDSGWSSWSPESEQRRDRLHAELLRQDLNEPPYRFGWGTVESTRDPRTGDSKIVVTYRY